MPQFDGSFRGPGRPKGSLCGRAQALLILDSVVSEERNQETLRTALNAELRKNPLRFFRQIIMPLLPKESIISTATGPQTIVWSSLLKSLERGETPVLPVPIRAEAKAIPATA